MSHSWQCSRPSWSFEQTGLMEDVQACGRGAGTRCSLRCLPTFHDSVIFHILFLTIFSILEIVVHYQQVDSLNSGGTSRRLQ